DLEAHGADPHLLRRQLRLRVALYTLVGVVGGIVTGIVLSVVVVGVVAVSAGARTPDPPLVLVVDWPRLLIQGGIAAAIALALVGLVTRPRGRGVSALLRPRWLS